MKKLRILALMHQHLVPPESIEGLSEKEIQPFKMELDVLATLRDLGHDVIPVPVKEELAPIRRAIEEHKPHIAFNLLVSFLDIGIYDAHVMSYLELLRTPYTGSNPRGIMLASNKPLSKKILSYHRIRVPGFAVYRLRRRRISKPKRLRFPLIVKSTVEHSSVGIAQASIVNDDASLKERVEFIHRHVGTSAIAEEYIEGRELTIGVLGNERLETFPVWEMFFKNLPDGAENIATSKVKWDIKYQIKLGVETGPAVELGADKSNEIAKLAKRIYRVLNLSGYARIDLRLTESGDVFVIEANPNPDLCNNEDLAQSAKLHGLTYPQLIQKILTLGQSYRPAWKER
jgi:D-alanine-D-alanine ligase